MEKEEFDKRLKAINAQYENAKIELFKEYGLSNAEFKTGDIIKDHRWTLLIDKITVYKMLDYPVPVYHGFELKKDLKIRKDKNRVAIYGNNAALIKAFVPAPKDDLGVTGGTNYL